MGAENGHGMIHMVGIDDNEMSENKENLRPTTSSTPALARTPTRREPTAAYSSPIDHGRIGSNASIALRQDVRASLRHAPDNSSSRRSSMSLAGSGGNSSSAFVSERSMSSATTEVLSNDSFSGEISPHVSHVTGDFEEID